MKIRNDELDFCVKILFDPWRGYFITSKEFIT